VGEACARCGKAVAPEGGARVEKRIVADLCDTCRQSVRFDLLSYLNTLDVPVVAVDPDVVVKIANDRANALFGKQEGGVLERRGGDVFECAYARLPGGCGKTLHCSACTIRFCVQETSRSGQPRIRVPAYLCQGGPGDEHEISMHISTEKIGDLVLLRIDRTDPAPGSRGG